jgi:hypothetical protein
MHGFPESWRRPQHCQPKQTQRSPDEWMPNRFTVHNIVGAKQQYDYAIAHNQRAWKKKP